MVFSSYVFILGFLPLTLLAVMVARHVAGRVGAVATLVVASMAFYAWWDWRFLALLWLSILFNYYWRYHRNRLLRTGIKAGLGDATFCTS